MAVTADQKWQEIRAAYFGAETGTRFSFKTSASRRLTWISAAALVCVAGGSGCPRELQFRTRVQKAAQVARELAASPQKVSRAHPVGSLQAYAGYCRLRSILGERVSERWRRLKFKLGIGPYVTIWKQLFDRYGLTDSERPRSENCISLRGIIYAVP